MSLHSFNFYWVTPLYFASQMGNTLFFMLSGYFAGKVHLDKVIKLERKTAFYSFFITLLVFLTGPGTITVKYLLLSEAPLLFNRYWFISVYIVLYAISPLLVLGLSALNGKQRGVIILMLMLHNMFLADNTMSLYGAVLAFLVGNWLRDNKPKNGIRKAVIRFLLFFVAYCSERVIVQILGVEHTQIEKGMRYLLTVFAAASLVALFKELKIRKGPLQVVITHLVLVYLLTAHPATVELIYGKLPVLQNSVLLFPFYMLMVIAVISLCVIVDVCVDWINTLETKAILVAAGRLIKR